MTASTFGLGRRLLLLLVLKIVVVAVLAAPVVLYVCVFYSANVTLCVIGRHFPLFYEKYLW